MSYDQRRAIAPFMDDRDSDEPQHVYIKSQSYPDLWTVGFYEPNGTWYPESDHDSPAAAAARVAYLNGRTQ